jgi:CheY-like chemotaxis protein
MWEKETHLKSEGMPDEHVRKGKQILVVEDHPESVELLRMILEDEGYSVQSVETGRRAIQAVSALSSDETPDPPPDLILLDLRLPDMTGVDVVRELQKNLPEVPPVVFLSADSPQSLKDAARSVGAAAVRKPFNLDELFEVIKRALAKQRDYDRSVKNQSPGFAT